VARKQDYTDFDPERLSASSCTVSDAHDGEGRYVQQRDGSGKYGHVKVIVSPHAGIHCFRFVWEPDESALPLSFMRAACFEGVRHALLKPLADGREIAFVQVSVIDGSYHHLDTDWRSLSAAAFLAVRNALERATLVNM